MSCNESIVVRVRRYSGTKGGPNYYHHADIITTSEEEALLAAREGRIRNWRWIDTYDISENDYKRFEVLETIDFEGAKKPAEPNPKG
jgi:hypothetical protein